MYVSTTTGSVTRHTDDGRQFEANLFTNFHKFGFIPNKNLRDLVLTTLTFGIFLASVLGIILFSSHAGRGMDGRNVTNRRTRSSAIPIILLHLNAEIGERAGAAPRFIA